MSESTNCDDDMFVSALQTPPDDHAPSITTDTPVNGRSSSGAPTQLTDTTVEISLNDGDESQDPGLGPHQAGGLCDPAQLAPSVEEDKGRREGHGADSSEAANADCFIDIRVVDAMKIGEGMSSYLAYKVVTHTNHPRFKSGKFSVMRRFSDFLGLYDKLCSKYVRIGHVVPQAPEKSVIGSTKMKMSHSPSAGAVGSEPAAGLSLHSNPTGSTSGSESDDFVQRRRHALERYLNRTARHPVLAEDRDLREFLELDGELPRATQTSTLSSAGVQRLFNRVGKTLNKMSFKMVESDPWFETVVQQVEALDNQLRKLHTSFDALVVQRRDVAQCTGQLSRAVAVLSNVEEHTALSRVLSRLSELQEQLQLLYYRQCDDDFFVVSEILKDHITLLDSVKTVFHEREKSFQTWQFAVNTLNKKRIALNRCQLQGLDDRVNQAKEEVAEWESNEDRCSKTFEEMSGVIKRELAILDGMRVEDIKKAFVEHLKALMNHQKEVASLWERFIPEVKSIP